MATYYSPAGNPEICEHKSQGYVTPEEWAALEAEAAQLRQS